MARWGTASVCRYRFNPVGDASQISSDKAGSDGHQGYGPMSFEPFALSLSKGQGKVQGRGHGER